MRLVLLLLLLSPALCSANEFVLTPLICVQQKYHSCAIQLKVRWQQAKPACLYLPPQTEPLLCGPAGVQQELALQLTKDSRFELRTADSQQVLAQRTIKVLTIDFNAGDKLLKRSRWGTQ